MSEIEYQCQAGCEAEQAPGSQFCDAHACILPNCGRKRSELSDLCETHKCIEAGCPTQATRFRRCDDHRCLQINCRRARLPDRQGCREHSCTFDLPCDRIQAKGYLFCVGHLCSHASGCKSSVALRRGTDGEPIDDTTVCDAHRCKWSGQTCFHAQAGSSKNCTEHKCRRCSQSRRSDDPFCHSHRDNCWWEGEEGGEGCRQVALKKHWYCRDHKCRKDCPKPRVDEESRRCADHKCIAVFHDSGMRCLNDSISDGAYCSGHTCPRSKCTGYQSTGYCPRHTCHGDDSGVQCLVEAQSNGYCFRHTCGADTGKKSNAGRCQKMAQSSGYCSQHTCLRSGETCWSQSQALSSGFCDQHTCWADRGKKRRCQQTTWSGGWYCKQHTCPGADSGVQCQDQARSSGYCDQHNPSNRVEADESRDTGSEPPYVLDGRNQKGHPTAPTETVEEAWKVGFKTGHGLGMVDATDIMLDHGSGQDTRARMAHRHKSRTGEGVNPAQYGYRPQVTAADVDNAFDNPFDDTPTPAEALRRVTEVLASGPDKGSRQVRDQTPSRVEEVA